MSSFLLLLLDPRKPIRCGNYNKSNLPPESSYSGNYYNKSDLPPEASYSDNLTSPRNFFLCFHSRSLSRNWCDKALCLIKTHCPTNWEARNSWSCFTNRNNFCSLSLNWSNKKVLENIHQMHIHVNHQRGLDLGTHKRNIERSNQELYRQQRNKELETQIHLN